VARETPSSSSSTKNGARSTVGIVLPLLAAMRSIGLIVATYVFCVN
jgi:hypothetical protein